jgi:hypothetical protein
MVATTWPGWSQTRTDRCLVSYEEPGLHELENGLLHAHFQRLEPVLVVAVRLQVLAQRNALVLGRVHGDHADAARKNPQAARPEGS